MLICKRLKKERKEKEFTQIKRRTAVVYFLEDEMGIPEGNITANEREQRRRVAKAARCKSGALQE